MSEVAQRKTIGTVCLSLATFLNPFGFDILVYKLMELTKDYWNTMYVLYLSSLLFFGLSFISFKLKSKMFGNIALTMALFLNPLGYDLVVYCINELTNNYWVTMGIMYALATLFFYGFMYFYNISFLSIINKFSKRTINNLKFNKNG